MKNIKPLISIIAFQLLFTTIPAYGNDKHNNCLNSDDYARCMNHQQCIKASDYEGCMSYNSTEKSNNLNKTSLREKCIPSGTLCLAKKGEDSLGLPKIVGWLYKELPERNGILYFDPNRSRVKVRGSYGRYIYLQTAYRYYRRPEAGTPGTITTSGTQNTTCRSYGSGTYDYMSTFYCTTDPSRITYTPGTPARPGGVVQVDNEIIIDCKEQTYGIHTNKRLTRNWRKLSNEPNSHLVKTVAEVSCPIIDRLPNSSFTKYAN